MEGNSLDRLRQKAALRLVDSAESAESAESVIDAIDYAGLDLARVVYELQIHQTELAMQNDELQRTQDELSAALQMYSDLYQSAPVAYVTIERNGKLLSANRAACSLFETTCDALIGSSIFEQLHTESQDGFYLHCQKVSGDKGTCELRLPERLQARYIRLDSVLVYDKNKGKETLRIAITDLTDQKELEAKRLAQQQIQKSELIKTLGVIAGGVAHDFNNLLTPIVMHTELVMNSLAPESGAVRDLECIASAVDDASAICQKLLDFAGPGSMTKTPICTSQFFADLLPAVQPSVPSTVSLIVDCKDPLPNIFGDAAQIRRVLVNLVINAVDAIGDRSGIIKIESSLRNLTESDFTNMAMAAINDAGQFVEFKITDDGCGMDAQTLSKVFDPFFTTKFTGRGLGMSSVMGIARDHFAAIEILSNPESGTCVSVYFPATNEPVVGDDEAAHVTQIPVENDNYLSTILVIDDDDLVRYSFVSLLKKAGFCTYAASSGAKAVEVYQKHGDSIDLVLLDLVMPDMDGPATLEAIRRIDPLAVVVLVSGYANAKSIERLDSKRIDGFIRKPCPSAKFISAIQDVLAQRSAH